MRSEAEPVAVLVSVSVDGCEQPLPTSEPAWLEYLIFMVTTGGFIAMVMFLMLMVSPAGT